MGLAAALPYVLAAGSSYAGAANEAHAMRKQDRQTAAGIMQQTARRNEANARVNQNLDQTAQSNPNGERKARLDEYLGALQKNRSTAGGATGNVSDAYRQRAAGTDQKVGDTSSALAGVLSRVDAAGDQRRGEAIGDARTGADVGVTQNLAAGDDFVNQMKVKAIQPNPWVALASKLGTAGAGMMAGSPTFSGAPKLADLGSVAKARTAGTLDLWGRGASAWGNA